MVYGYIRTTLIPPSEELQRGLLEDFGCESIFFDKNEFKIDHRPELDELKRRLKTNDTLVLYRLDRAILTTKELAEWGELIRMRKISLVSLEEGITGDETPLSTLFIAFERFMTLRRKETTQLGLERSRARGLVGGRPIKVTPDEVKQMQEMYNRNEMSIKTICEHFGISKPTFYKYIKE